MQNEKKNIIIYLISSANSGHVFIAFRYVKSSIVLLLVITVHLLLENYRHGGWCICHLILASVLRLEESWDRIRRLFSYTAKDNRVKIRRFRKKKMLIWLKMFVGTYDYMSWEY